MGNHGEIIAIGKLWEEDRRIVDSYGIRLEVMGCRSETTINHPTISIYCWIYRCNVTPSGWG